MLVTQISYNRFEKQCVKCACYYQNTEGEVRQVMDEAQIECSNERSLEGRTPCDCFQEKGR